MSYLSVPLLTFESSLFTFYSVSKYTLYTKKENKMGGFAVSG